MYKDMAWVNTLWATVGGMNIPPFFMEMKCENLVFLLMSQEILEI